MGADSLAKNNPKCPRIYLPNLSAKAQQFWISMKKVFIGCLCSPCFDLAGQTGSFLAVPEISAILQKHPTFKGVFSCVIKVV